MSINWKKKNIKTSHLTKAKYTLNTTYIVNDPSPISLSIQIIYFPWQKVWLVPSFWNVCLLKSRHFINNFNLFYTINLQALSWRRRTCNTAMTMCSLPAICSLTPTASQVGTNVTFLLCCISGRNLEPPFIEGCYLKEHFNGKYQ